MARTPLADADLHGDRRNRPNRLTLSIPQKAAEFRPVPVDKRHHRPDAIWHAHQLGFLHELGLQLHSAEALDLAVDVVVALDQSNTLDLGASLERR